MCTNGYEMFSIGDSDLDMPFPRTIKIKIY